MRLQIRLSSTVLLRPVQVTVALPDGFSKARPPYKTVWALHPAMSDGGMFFSDLGVEEIAQKEGFAFVAPSLGNGYYVNKEHERQADFLSEELLPVLRQTLPLATGRDANALLGISMGGYGALRWALDRPETFSAALVFSGVFERPLPDHPLLRTKRALRALCGILSPIMRRQFQNEDGSTRPEADLQLLLNRFKNSHAGPTMPHFRLYCGDGDYLALPHCQDMLERLQSCGGRAMLTLSPGSHDTTFWRGILDDALRQAFTEEEVDQ